MTGGIGVAADAVRRQLYAVRTVFARPALRDCQLVVGLRRAVDLAQLVSVSAYLFVDSGAGAVAAYGVVRAAAPAAAVPVVVSASARLGHGRLLGLLAAAACGCTAGMVAAVAREGPLWIVLALAAGVHVALGAVRPLTSALTPSLVRTPEELVVCTAAAGLLDAGAMLVGPLVAGVVLGVAGPPWALASTVGLLGTAAVLAARLPRTTTMPRSAHGERRSGGIRTFVTTRESALLGALGTCQTFVRGALYVLVVPFTVQVMGRDDGVAGVLLCAIGVGGVLGLPLGMAVVTRRRLYRSYGLGLAVWGAPLALAAGLPDLVAVLLLFALVGFGNDVVDVSLYTALPRALPDRVLAQAFGVLEALFQLGTALGAAAAGALLTQLDPQVGLCVVGLLLPVAALAAAPWLRRCDARLETHDLEVDLLRRQPLFRELSMLVLDTVAARLTPTAFRAGDVIMTQGEPGDRYVIIADGVVTIVRDGLTAATLPRGEAFGEIALVRETPRTATAIAATEVVARTLDREAFLAALGCDPRAWAAAEEVADARS